MFADGPERQSGAGFALALSISAAATLIGAWPVDAAMRTCTARLTSVAGKDASELGAKKKAINDWVSKAKAAGIKNPAWRLAAQRQLTCAASDGSTAFECVAVGHACEILQVPPRPKPNPSPNLSPNPRPSPNPAATPERGLGVDT